MKKLMVIMMVTVIGMAFVTGCKKDDKRYRGHLRNDDRDKKVDSDLRRGVDESNKLKIGSYVYGL